MRVIHYKTGVNAAILPAGRIICRHHSDSHAVYNGKSLAVCRPVATLTYNPYSSRPNKLQEVATPGCWMSRAQSFWVVNTSIYDDHNALAY